jgi:glycosyltransferase involved in cell wall biosynthesis
MKSLSPISIPLKVIGRLASGRRLRPGPGTEPGSRVLMVTQYLFLGGLERMILNLATSLKTDLNWKPEVFVFDHAKNADPASHLGGIFESENIAVHYFSKSQGFSPRAVWKLIELIVSREIGVIHTHDLGALIYGGLAKLGCLGSVRLVHTQHSFVHLGRKKRYRIYEKFFTALADELAVVSPDTKTTYLELGVRAEKITFVANGVRFAEKRSDKALAKSQVIEGLDYKMPPFSVELLQKAHWILYMARVHGRKGQEHAVGLWNSLQPELRTRCGLLFVGLETEKGQLEKLRLAIEHAQDSDRIFYMGPTHRPLQWLQASDLFLSCSEFEGMPLASIEAIGSGLPLVLSSIAGHESLKSVSAQYSLESPAQGAREVQKIISRIESEGSHYFDALWSESEKIRDQYSVVQMAREYSRLYCQNSK